MTDVDWGKYGSRITYGAPLDFGKFGCLIGIEFGLDTESRLV